MKQSKSLILILGLIVSATLFNAKAQAGLLLEPYIGYGSGKIEFSSSDLDTKGVYYGGRLGYQSLGFMAGLDFMSGKMEDDNSPKRDVTPTTMGVFVGFNFPVMLRVYGVYNFKSKAEVETLNTYEGTGIKLGVGFTALPLVSINLEYMDNTFDEGESGALTTDIKHKMYGLSVSVPFDFM